jgi:hypothetical protein
MTASLLAEIRTRGLPNRSTSLNHSTTNFGEKESDKNLQKETDDTYFPLEQQDAECSSRLVALLRIREVPGTNLGQKTRYPN